MVIPVTYIEENLTLKFMPYGFNTLRLWIRDDSEWFQSVGWCPHINMNGFECSDCALNVE